MLARMDVWLDFARWAYDFRLQVWGVIGAALLLAWLQRFSGGTSTLGSVVTRSSG